MGAVAEAARSGRRSASASLIDSMISPLILLSTDIFTLSKVHYFQTHLLRFAEPASFFPQFFLSPGPGAIAIPSFIVRNKDERNRNEQIGSNG